MIFLWIKLLLFHLGYALIPVTTVHLGESVTFTCFFPGTEYSNTRIRWYKQSFGETLVLITTLMKATPNPSFEQGFSPSRFEAQHNITMSTLTILETIQEDEAMYHCGVFTWSRNEWSATVLSLKGNTQKTSAYTVVQWPAVVDPVHPGDLMSLQCSVFSDSENKSCQSSHSVHWFVVSSDKSHANVIYTDGNLHDECGQKLDSRSSTKSCVYSFSKNASSSDAGTYYCAVVACGEIMIGNGVKLDIEGNGFDVVQHNMIPFLLCAVFAISVTVIAFLLCTIKKNKCDCCNNKAAVSLQGHFAKRNLKRDGDARSYSAAVYTVMNTCSGGLKDAKAGNKERIYAALKAFGLD